MHFSNCHIQSFALPQRRERCCSVFNSPSDTEGLQGWLLEESTLAESFKMVRWREQHLHSDPCSANRSLILDQLGHSYRAEYKLAVHLIPAQQAMSSCSPFAAMESTDIRKGADGGHDPVQISGGHRYQPPRKDVFAPDLYIPSMSICTYVVLLGIVQFHHGKFSPEGMYLMVRLLVLV